MIPNIKIKSYIQMYQISQFAFRLNYELTVPDFNECAPFVIQLYIILTSNDDNFCNYLLINDFGNTIDYLREVLPAEFHPLLMICMYNLCSISNLIQNGEKAQNFIKGKLFCLTEEHYYLIPLILINILRNHSIDDEEVNKTFFNIMTHLIINGDETTVINSIWCLYFWFKNSYQIMDEYITNSFVQMISNLMNTDNEIIVAISLYIYSIMFFSTDQKIIFYLENNLNITNVINFIKFDSPNISSCAIVLCNNFISLKFENLSCFEQNNGLDGIMWTIDNGSFRAKIEAGFLLITFFHCINDEMFDDRMSDEIIKSFCDLLTIGEYQIQYAILKFLAEAVIKNEFVLECLENAEFENLVLNLELTYEELTELSNEILHKINERRNESV